MFVALILVARAAWADDPAWAAAIQLPPGRPTQVAVSIELVEVSQIVDRDQKVEMEFYVYYTWRDPKMAFDPGREGAKRKLISVDDIWNPDPQLLDELDVNVRGRKAVHVYPDGTLVYSRYYRGMIGGCLDLHEFPLDKHQIEVDLEESVFEADQVVFVPAGVRALNPERAVPHGWKLNGLSTESKISAYSKTGEQFSLMRMKLQVERDPHYYFWGIVLPLIPIVAAAGTVFWMDPKEFSSQVSIGITSTLTIVAYRISIDSSLPPLNYMTRLDYFFLSCQIFVFGAFIVVLGIHVLYNSGAAESHAAADRLTVNCRWMPPVLLATTTVLLVQLPASCGSWVLIGSGVVFVAWFQPSPSQMRVLIRALFHPERLATSDATSHHAPTLRAPRSAAMNPKTGGRTSAARRKPRGRRVRGSTAARSSGGDINRPPDSPLAPPCAHAAARKQFLGRGGHIGQRDLAREAPEVELPVAGQTAPNFAPLFAPWRHGVDAHESHAAEDKRIHGERQGHAAHETASRDTATGEGRTQERGQGASAHGIDAAGPAGLEQRASLSSAIASRGRISLAPSRSSNACSEALPVTAATW